MKLIETTSTARGVFTQPVRSWAEDIEESALVQLNNLANLPFLHQWVCAMPDCHSGYGMPIGAVIATKGVVIPNAVGVDIGCGMCAIETKIDVPEHSVLEKIVEKIKERIPVGFNSHAEKQNACFMPHICLGTEEDECYERYPIVSKHYGNALKQLGTLGGGNHFIELQKDSKNKLWVMIHSGSRNLGKQVADHYNDIAKELNKTWFSTVPAEWELAFLPAKTVQGALYLKEMQYCVEYALSNRKLMMIRVSLVLEELGLINSTERYNALGAMINIAHNYAKLENHMGKNVYVHRKGATSAREGEIGIIPGSMGTKSYIVKGLGNVQSFMSCSHGAGRKMGRNQAIKNLSLAEEQAKMVGVIGAPTTQQELEEAPGAYKDIVSVMECQNDLVQIVTELSPVAVIKG